MWILSLVFSTTCHPLIYIARCYNRKPVNLSMLIMADILLTRTKNKAICVICNAQVKCCSNTPNLRKHLTSRPWFPQSMNEWINEWMNQWINEWMNQWINEWINESMNEWINEWMNQWMNGGWRRCTVLFTTHVLKHGRRSRCFQLLLSHYMMIWTHEYHLQLLWQSLH